MHISEFCIRRPVFATVLSLLVVLIGLVSYDRLSVREYPAIDEPVVSVITNYRGASPDVIESQVTKPLEVQFSGIGGVVVMSSRGRSERSIINIKFDFIRSPHPPSADGGSKSQRGRVFLPVRV